MRTTNRIYLPWIVRSTEATVVESLLHDTACTRKQLNNLRYGLTVRVREHSIRAY